MSTHDVPGARAENRDELAALCWAEHEDGSLILVESTEGDRAIFSVFDMSKDPPMEYRDAMPIDGFKTQFSWDRDKPNDPDNICWTWHDKTAFPWDRIIKEGIQDGSRFACAQHPMTAAEKIKQSMELRGRPVIKDELKSRRDRLGKVGRIIIDALQAVIEECDP